MPRRRDPWDIPTPDLRARVCDCGMDIPPQGVTPTALWVARHKVRHLDVCGGWTTVHGMAILRDLVDALEVELARRRDDIADRDDRIEDLEADLDAINRGVR